MNKNSFTIKKSYNRKNISNDWKNNKSTIFNNIILS